MKKIIIASLLVVMAATASFGADQGCVFADAGKNVVAHATGGAAIGRLSTNDALGFAMTTLGYTLVTQHLQGTRSYGTANDGTAIYWTTETKGGTSGTGHATPGTVGVTYFNTGWTVM